MTMRAAAPSLSLLIAALLPAPAMAQDHSGHAMPGMDMSPPASPPAPDHADHEMAGMDMSGESMPGMDMSAGHAGQGSGTARLPSAEPMRGAHLMAGEWMIMAHGTASAQYTRHTGPRGDDKFYVTTMAMLEAGRDTGFGHVALRSMLSLEPAMDPRGYPNLFATGETANGQPLVDRQHPHDLFMELAARVDFGHGTVKPFLYGGPVGEPALGPSVFMMRGSARLNPEPPISHHWFDSTHITYGVITAGLASPRWQLEGSAFRGQEPDERRWNIETPRLDSWSVRATWTPGPNWALQVSHGHLVRPEATHPDENEDRTTASVHYADGKGLSAMAGWSRKDRQPGEALTAWLAEGQWDLDRANTLFGRVESVANDELFPDHDDPLHDTAFRVTKFQAGYARRLLIGPIEAAAGGSVAAYAKPAALDAAYGRNPIGYTLFVRFSLVG